LRPAISIKFNTAKRRTHSLFRQGRVAYALIPKMPETRLRPLLERFDQMLREIPVFAAGRGLPTARRRRCLRFIFDALPPRLKKAQTQPRQQ
jgi:hypothetical protein